MMQEFYAYSDSLSDGDFIWGALFILAYLIYFLRRMN